METTLVIKNILLPKLEKDPKFSEEKVDSAFWEKFAIDLLHFEEDAKPLYVLIYSLELDNPEKIIDKLPLIYAQFLKELAESYVLGQTTEATDYLSEKNNEAFLKEVQFLETMQQAIKSVERKRIKVDLPKSYERLTFEISDTDLANIARKKGREDLREKMKQWDAELEKQESVPVISMANREEKTIKAAASKISFTWMKYASIAAIFIIGFMIWQPNKLSNDKLFSQYSSEESIIKPIDYQKMATISESGGERGSEILFQNYTKSETEEAMTAIELFKNNNFEKAKKILITLNPKEKNNQLLLFLAIAQLKTNEVNEAVSNLEYLNAISNYEFSDETKFHLALGYIKQNEKKKAKVLLVTLVTNDSKYSKPSQEILDKIRWF